MGWDLLIELDDRPGTVAEVAEALADAGINIEGVCGLAVGGAGLLHVLVPDPREARAALDRAGISVSAEREVVVVDCPDAPGELAQRTRAVADAGVNLGLVYLGSRTRLVLGGDDLDGIRDALS